MSDQQPQYTDDPTVEELRARADKADGLERTTQVQGAELAILRAGVPTGTKIGQAFVQELATRTDIDLGNSDAIHTAALEWGLWHAEGEDEKVPPAQQNLANARQGIQTGSAPDAAPPPPPNELEEGWAKFKSRVYDQGARRQDAAAEVIDRLITGAVKGDERARVINQPGGIQRRYEDRDIPFVSGREL